MLPASNRGPGMAMGFPDVCLTPSPAGPVPIPYPNIAMNAQAAPFAVSVKVNMMNALNLASQIPLTSGDEAGSAHPTVKGPQMYSMGSPNVFVEGMPAITLASLTTHNNMNCPVGAVIVPSAVNVMFSRVADDSGEPCAVDPRATRQLQLEQLRELAGAARGPSVTSAGVVGEEGMIRITTFALSAGAELHAALEALTRQAARAITIDVRGSAGGTLEGALAAASQLVPEGTLLLIETEADGDVIEHRASGGAFPSLPVRILVDGATASAAEVFAGSLQQAGRAQLVGARTYGKGITQRLAVDASGASVGVRMSSLQLASGAPIDRFGLDPDQ